MSVETPLVGYADDLATLVAATNVETPQLRIEMVMRQR